MKHKKSNKSFKNNNLSIFLFVSLILFMGMSLYKPHDYFTWVMEAFPIFIGLPVLFVTREKTPLTHFIITILWIHCLILIIGAHYTYAEVPFFKIGDRNNYDKVGHFMQGFMPALLGRELLIRTSSLKPGKWMFVLLVLAPMGISAIYEIIEWQTAALTGTAADAFLGTQGDVWDTQKDMMWAGIGALIAMVFFTGIHDRIIAKMDKK